ncbi:MAG: hypothetical protein IPO92_02175 [Saprospiraceae bacterium]|nr:hypothetical protein [Saprospiraceae bacterium]
MLRWKPYLTSHIRLLKIILLAIMVGAVVSLFSEYMIWNENRIGVSFDDPILNLFMPINVSRTTSLLTLMPIFLALAFILRSPTTTVYFFIASIMICIFRSITLYFVVLEAPIHIIPLTDPIIENMFYGGQVLLKDLFFSGHTANLILVGFLVHEMWMKRLLLISGVLVGGLLLLQHVHYSIDVLAAPFFSVITYKISIYLGNTLFLNDFKKFQRSGEILKELGFRNKMLT